MQSNNIVKLNTNTYVSCSVTAIYPSYHFHYMPSHLIASQEIFLSTESLSVLLHHNCGMGLMSCAI